MKVRIVSKNLVAASLDVNVALLVFSAIPSELGFYTAECSQVRQNDGLVHSGGGTPTRRVCTNCVPFTCLQLAECGCENDKRTEI